MNIVQLILALRHRREHDTVSDRALEDINRRPLLNWIDARPTRESGDATWRPTQTNY